MRIWFGPPLEEHGVKLKGFYGNVYWVLKFDGFRIYVVSTHPDKEYKCWQLLTSNRDGLCISMKLINYCKSVTFVRELRNTLYVKIDKK